MRRFGVAAGAFVAVAVIAFAAYGGSNGRLPLQSPRPVTTHLLGLVSGRRGIRLARVNPATLRIEQASGIVRARSAWGWVVSPGGRRVAVATCRRTCNSFVLHLANSKTLRWDPHGVSLDAGQFYAALWLQSDKLYVLDGGTTSLGLDAVDTSTNRVVARTPIAGPVFQMARSANGLVLLAGEFNAIVPGRLVVVDADGSVRTAGLQRILVGTHFDQQSQDPIGATNMPGLAVDAQHGIAYVVDGSGVVGAVRLGDLAVSYHQLGSGSLFGRFAAWLTPSAEAKEANGSTVAARWLGRGLMAVAGGVETFAAGVDTSRPTGLRIVDTRSWSVRMLDPNADTDWVGDGLLLATGTTARYTQSSSHVHREGLVAYGPDGSLRWRLTRVMPFVLATYRSRALLPGPDGIPLVVDLRSGHIIGKASPDGWPVLLLGAGSPP
jgi:hypothetical protein